MRSYEKVIFGVVHFNCLKIDDVNDVADLYSMP